jgi:flagellar motor switch protein FliG
MKSNALIKINGLQAAVEALRGLDSESQQRILKDIAKVDSKKAELLNDGLFQFSDLQYLLGTDFKVLWWEIPRDQWHLALRNAPPEIWKMLESKLSKRASAELAESVKALGPQPLSKVQKAQREICALVLSLAAQGRMAIPKA